MGQDGAPGIPGEKVSMCVCVFLGNSQTQEVGRHYNSGKSTASEGREP